MTKVTGARAKIFMNNITTDLMFNFAEMTDQQMDSFLDILDAYIDLIAKSQMPAH